MQSRVIFKYIALTAIFLLALVMEIMPWPNGFQSVKPAWVVLIFMYWGLSIPNRVSIGWAFMIGILWDVVLGTLLGAHALVLSIFAYLITKNHLVFRNLSLWMQSLLVIFFVFAIRFSIFLIEFMAMVIFITPRSSPPPWIKLIEQIVSLKPHTLIITALIKKGA